MFINQFSQIMPTLSIRSLEHSRITLNSTTDIGLVTGPDTDASFLPFYC